MNVRVSKHVNDRMLCLTEPLSHAGIRRSTDDAYTTYAYEVHYLGPPELPVLATLFIGYWYCSDDGEDYGKFAISQLDEEENERAKDIGDGRSRPESPGNCAESSPELAQEERKRTRRSDKNPTPAWAKADNIITGTTEDSRARAAETARQIEEAGGNMRHAGNDEEEKSTEHERKRDDVRREKKGASNREGTCAEEGRTDVGGMAAWDGGGERGEKRISQREGGKGGGGIMNARDVNGRTAEEATREREELGGRKGVEEEVTAAPSEERPTVRGREETRGWG